MGGAIVIQRDIFGFLINIIMLINIVALNEKVLSDNNTQLH